ncbi:hypothetical protein C8R44DRAFT_877269 [Mycena epipterygia]|nr:hypothetical protein C8R44DRAFT_877269 [Mycena epipterygia]
MSSKAVAPTRAIQDHVPLKILQPSRSLRWNLPVSDSANLSRRDEDVTLCYAPRPSEGDLTACASAPSFKMKSTKLPSLMDLSFPDLPEIPDWYEDEQPRQARDPTTTPQSAYHATPQSDYHSLADFHPASICCQMYMPQCGGIAPTAGSPALASFKHQPKTEHPMQAPSHARPRYIRRSYSLDLTNHRPAGPPYTTPPEPRLGYGLGSPFSPSPLSSAAYLGPLPSNAELHIYSSVPDDMVRYTSPSFSFTAHPNLHLNQLHLIQSPPGLRRDEALAVWRPEGPIPSCLDAGSSPDSLSDSPSLEQPFPSSASIWVLDAQPSSALPHSASWPLHARTGLESRHRVRGEEKAVGMHRWSLEEQITIAVLEAMDSRDRRSAGRVPCPRLVVGRQGRVRRLLGRIWRREAAV